MDGHCVSEYLRSQATLALTLAGPGVLCALLLREKEPQSPVQAPQPVTEMETTADPAVSFTKARGAAHMMELWKDWDLRADPSAWIRLAPLPGWWRLH